MTETTTTRKRPLHERSDAELAPAAERAGCTIQELRDASMHVSLGERFPFLRVLPAWAAALFYQLLQDLPEREQYLFAAKVIDCGLRVEEAFDVLRAFRDDCLEQGIRTYWTPTGRVGCLFPCPELLRPRLADR